MAPLSAENDREFVSRVERYQVFVRFSQRIQRNRQTLTGIKGRKRRFYEIKRFCNFSSSIDYHNHILSHLADLTNTVPLVKAFSEKNYTKGWL
jgi:hypothetical protein